MNREELRRLEKAAREKDKKYLLEWALQFEDQINNEYKRNYELMYEKDIQSSVDNYTIALLYTLLFSEESKLYMDPKNIGDFMCDLYATLDLYRTGEYKPSEYEKELQEHGITISYYDYNNVYKKFLNNMDTELVSYLKHKPRKSVLLLTDPKNNDLLFKAYKQFNLKSYMVYLDSFVHYNDNEEKDKEAYEVLNRLNQEKVLIADVLYIINKDENDNRIMKLTEYAKLHNKEIKEITIE